MKREPTKQEIMDEMQRLRADYEQIRRRTKELGHQTTRLYYAIEKLPAASQTRTTLKT